MIRSMTGFGGGNASGGGWRIEATIRTLNNRFLSIRTRALADRPWLQTRTEDRIRKEFSRGEVSVSISIDRETGTSGGATIFDMRAASDVCGSLRKLASELDLPSPSLNDLIRAGGLKPMAETEEELWPVIEEALSGAINGALTTREAEGRVLRDEILRILSVLDASTASIRDRLPEILRQIEDKLRQRIEDLDLTVEPTRFEAEVMLLVDRYDIQEELIRLTGHIGRVRTLLERDDPAGKELDFLSQELLREINTIGSKARDSVVSGQVIDMKVAVEQLREQVQNVE